jgi:hypothetical protein
VRDRHERDRRTVHLHLSVRELFSPRRQLQGRKPGLAAARAVIHGDRLLTGHVHIRLSYHGGPWRYHRVSAGFWEKLQVYLGKRTKTLDVVAELSPYPCGPGCTEGKS